MNLEFRSIPLWLLKEYLIELGGHATSEEHVVGDGWEARLSKGEPVFIGSLRLGVTNLRLEGNPASIEALLSGLELKTLRGGG